MRNQEPIDTELPLKRDMLSENASTLSNEIAWFVNVINARLSDFFPQEKGPTAQFSTEKKVSFLSGFSQSKPNKTSSPTDFVNKEIKSKGQEIKMPDLSNDHSVYAEFVNYYKLNANERIFLMLILLPHVQPHLLDVFFSLNRSLGRGYTEFGGVKGSRHSGFIPTIETALFILAGNDLSKRFQLYQLFDPDHIFSAHNIINIDQGHGSEPFYSSTINISEEYVDYFTTGNLKSPQFSMEFPAKKLTTKMEWNDLIIDEFTASQLDEIRIWLDHGQTLYGDWGMNKKLKPGFKALFHGPSGTGKTLTACLLGKLYNLDVYRIDLSMVISKYIGETEKNLEKVFKKAENKKWILFFDEADALFGKRTGISDSHDKYANQEIAYLLQRLEDYPGLMILASNLSKNVDDAFNRRLQSIIYFQKPQPLERYKLWLNAFSSSCIPPKREELERLAQQYELSGGAIMNVVQYASLMTLSRNEKLIPVDLLLQGIKKEFRKEGKTV